MKPNTNEVLNCIRSRHAIRRFQDRQLEEAVLQEILTAGLYAPSAGGNQDSRIVVCQDPEINRRLGELSRWMQFKGADPKAVSHSISADQPSIQDDHTLMDGFYHAPTVLTIFSGATSYAHDNAALIAGYIWLAAHSLGVGACYVGRTEEVFATEYGQQLRREWNIPENMTPVCNVLLGYPVGPVPREKPRREGRIFRI